jgi:hypothetical protein
MSCKINWDIDKFGVIRNPGPGARNAITDRETDYITPHRDHCTGGRITGWGASA